MTQNDNILSHPDTTHWPLSLKKNLSQVNVTIFVVSVLTANTLEVLDVCIRPLWGAAAVGVHTKLEQNI